MQAHFPAPDTQDELARLAAIIESSSDAIISKDLNGTILTWNRGAAAIYGYAAEEAIGRSIHLLVAPDRMAEEEAILARLRDGKRVQHFETVRINKSGLPIHVSLTISPIFGKNGIVGASDVARDITERKRLDAAIAQLAAIVESSEDAIISKDLSGTIQTWNTSAERLYGYTAQEAIGRNMTILQPAGREHEETEILQRAARGERVDHFETERVKKDGSVVKVSLTISPIRDRRGVVAGASHIARDISKQKEVEEQLRQTQRLESLGVLAGGVAHDFNNLLTGILGNASLAAELLPPDLISLRSILDDVMRASERAANLTQQLLAYAGKGRFAVVTLDVTALIREISHLVQSTIPKNVQVRLELDENVPCIEGDAAQVQQVVMNLLINAAEAIPEGRAGSVRIAARASRMEEVDMRSSSASPIATPFASQDPGAGEYVMLEVSDNGSGMDEATRARIFDPFFTTKFLGRGLGLAAVLGIIRGHKGVLRVSSEPGQGSTFQVLFPASSKRGVVPVQRKSAIAGWTNGNKAVLVIDDETTVLRVARASLESHGFRVIQAENGSRGIDLFREHQGEIAAVLLDLSMPEMDGEEVLRRLRGISTGVKVVLSSGFNEAEAVRRFSAEELAGFIQKPYTAIALANKISDVVGKEDAGK
jgi:PAS domain S-box-containing protein